MIPVHFDAVDIAQMTYMRLVRKGMDLKKFHLIRGPQPTHAAGTIIYCDDYLNATIVRQYYATKGLTAVLQNLDNESDYYGMYAVWTAQEVDQCS